MTNPASADQISPLDMFKIGVGPSSSHTLGPMLAARMFREAVIDCLATQGGDRLANQELIVEVELFGSLSAVGAAHLTDGAVCAGLVGLDPKTADPDQIWQAMPELKRKKKIKFSQVFIHFDPQVNLKMCGWFIDEKPLPHPNVLRLRLLVGTKPVLSKVIMSVGGGLIEEVDPTTDRTCAPKMVAVSPLPYPYNSAAEFIRICKQSGLAPWQIVIENQKVLGLSEEKLRSGLKTVLNTFNQCIDRGLAAEGILPGGLNVRRRAKALYEEYKSGKRPRWSGGDLRPSIYAMAVNEENAAGSRIATAPTNGASGLLPGVWRTLAETNNLSETTLINGLIVASVIGALTKVHASISGAEVGCQGEVGTACAMAAAGAVIMLDGTIEQMEQAAEIGLEHHLGLTCDPINGLVQVPCIERNAIGAVKALNAASLALASDGQHLVSFDKVLAVMKQTGLDMNQKYKETATGGLAIG